MKQFLFLALLIPISVCCGLHSFANNTYIKCPNGYVYTESNLLDEATRHSPKGCYNRNLGLIYEEINGKKHFYATDEPEKYGANISYCGVNCDLSGKNCEQGACRSEDCSKVYGKNYTKFSYENRCCDPKKGISRIGRHFFIGRKSSYYVLIEEGWCGTDCDQYGRHCSVGGCLVADCPLFKRSHINRGKCYGLDDALSLSPDIFFNVEYPEDYTPPFYGLDDVCKSVDASRKWGSFNWCPTK